MSDVPRTRRLSADQARGSRVVEFEQGLTEARLVRRYRRFLADVEDAGGRQWTVHCPNTGSMLGCTEPGSRVWLSHSARPGRKYAHTWELVELPGSIVVGVHTGRANALVGEALDAGLLPGLSAYATRRREVRVPDAPMRADWLLEDHPGGEPPCFVEVKNVTAAVEHGRALFPDAVTERGRRHLEVLADWVRGGGRAALIFCVQRSDALEVRPAESIDPRYVEALREAAAAGVDLRAIRLHPSATGIRPDCPLPVHHQEEP
nr:DNA/RNA nuclease SfsA [Halorhodospira sp. M38]